MMPWPGLLEPLTESICLGIVASVCAHNVIGVNPFLFFLLHMTVWFCLDLALIKVVEVRLESSFVVLLSAKVKMLLSMQKILAENP